jgi:amino acid permease
LDELLTKEEILGGLPAGRARTLLFLIESKTAHGMAHAQQEMDVHLTEEGERRRDSAFLEAFALGREPPLRPRIQDLERFVPLWASLLPDNVRLRAAIAHALGAKYRVRYRSVPHIRRALGLDTEAVQAAYDSQYGVPLATVYTPRDTLTERLRWAQYTIAVRLESLPPFWTAFALTLTETVGAGILALPIALARVGPRGGLVLLVILGLVNVLTIAAMAESVTRTGSVRYGNAFFGRLVGEYLGSLGSLVSTLANITLNATALLAYFVGFARVMGDVIRLPVELWAGVLFVVCLYFLTRGSLSSTITSALVIGGINLVLLLLLSFLALGQLQPENLLPAATPLAEGQSFDPQVLGLIFGVILLAYCGHNSVGNCGRIVLRRDPGGRSLLRGTVAAQLVAIVLYCLWVVAVHGAVAPDDLASYQGTSIEPLAAVLGPAAYGLGTVYAVLAIAMVSVHTALALFNAVRERLPEAGVPSRGSVPSPFARGHFMWCLLPVLLLFAIAEWLLFSHNENFTGVMNFGGVVGASVFSGIMPVLLLAASRRKGDLLPAVVYRVIGHPLLLGAVYLLFLAGIWLHGLVIWQDPGQRLAAVVCGVVVLILTVRAAKKGAFHRRLVMQFRQNRGDEQAMFSLVAGGKAAEADVVATDGGGDVCYHAASGQVPNAALLRRLTLQFQDIAAHEAKVWAHQVEPEGTSTPLPALLTIWAADGEVCALQELDAGPVLVPWRGQDGRVELAFRSSDSAAVPGRTQEDATMNGRKMFG